MRLYSKYGKIKNKNENRIRNTYKAGTSIAIKTNLSEYILSITRVNPRIMEIRIKTGKLTKNLSILNTYAPDSNYEFNEIREYWEAVDNFAHNLPKNLIKCWRTDNNGQPQNNEENKKYIGKWTLENKEPNINGLHLMQACEQNELDCCNTFYIPKMRIKENSLHGIIIMGVSKTNRLLFNTTKL